MSYPSARTIVTALIIMASVAPAAQSRTESRVISQECWIEFGAGDAPGAMGAAGAKIDVWHNTASGLLIRHRDGDVLVDAGWSRDIASQMSELSARKRPVAERILAGLAWRRSAPEALADVSERPAALRYILPTHAHYDHLGGAQDLPRTPILMSPAEIAYLDAQLVTPDIVPASSIRAVRNRLRPIAFQEKAYLGFERSFDLFGDGSIVVVPLPGHTPGSVGIFTTIKGRRTLLVGDVVFVAEAIAGGLPKVGPLRDVVDDDGTAADRQVGALQAFSRAHPEILILPAHDRTVWQSAFGPSPGCVRSGQ